ncbi:MAG: zinc ribbon domain-containing protein [Oscillospiraceae bacterium]|nr:zinc ribbon domain-containing protein [Oscillospiraceae bacterium]
MPCPKCNQNLPADSAFCNHCGTSLKPTPPQQTEKTEKNIAFLLMGCVWALLATVGFFFTITDTVSIANMPGSNLSFFELLARSFFLGAIICLLPGTGAFWLIRKYLRK